MLAARVESNARLTGYVALSLWFLATAGHVVNYVHLAPELALAEWRDHLRGALTRRALVAGSFATGIALALAMLPFPTTFQPSHGG